MTLEVVNIITTRLKMAPPGSIIHPTLISRVEPLGKSTAAPVIYRAQSPLWPSDLSARFFACERRPSATWSKVENIRDRPSESAPISWPVRLQYVVVTDKKTGKDMEGSSTCNKSTQRQESEGITFLQKCIFQQNPCCFPVWHCMVALKVPHPTFWKDLLHEASFLGPWQSSPCFIGS